MKRCIALAVLALCLATGALSAQVATDPPVRPPQIDPAAPPAGLPQLPPGGPGAVPGGPGGFPGFPMQADHKELVAALLELIDDADAEVRASVAQALGKIGRQAVNPVLDILKNKEKSAAVRANAAYILGHIGPQAQEALPTLTKALKETDKDLRKRAAYAIAHIVGDEFGIQGFAAPGIFGPGGIGGGLRGPGQGVPPKVVDPGVVGPDIKKIPDPKPIDPKPIDPDKKPN